MGLRGPGVKCGGIVHHIGRGLVVARHGNAPGPRRIGEGARTQVFELFARARVRAQVQRALHDECELNATKTKARTTEESFDIDLPHGTQGFGDFKRPQR